MKTLLTMAYDGSAYYGWQKQPGRKTIQGTLEDSLLNLYKQPIITLGASRTDSGVHAFGQRVCFVTPKINIPIENLPMALNGLLPDDIVITEARHVHKGFCTINDAKRKTYEYTILNRKYPDPKLRNYVCHITPSLDIDTMKQACKAFEGTHDFTAFCASGSKTVTKVRTVYRNLIEAQGDIIKIYITGNGFLYNMVRIIAGTLIEVGLGRISAIDVSEIIKSRDRAKAGKTAPAKGLTLVSVEYDPF